MTGSVVDYAAATALEGSDGRYGIVLHPNIATPIGPLGSYVAGIAIRAAGAKTSFERPSSFTCHFLRPAKPGERVDVEVVSLRSTRRAESLRVSINQDGREILEAIVWATSDTPGAEHSFAMPDVPGPENYLPLEECFADWTPWGERLVEIRPMWDWTPPSPPPWRDADWDGAPVGGTSIRDWSRILGDAGGDPYLEAARLLHVVDNMTINAAFNPHRREGNFMLPHIEMSAYFHDLSGAEWMYQEGDTPSAATGLAWGRAVIWAQDGRLLATGMAQMMQRPRPDALR